MCALDYLQSQTLVLSVRGGQLLLRLSEFLLCLLTGAPQVLHLVPPVHSALTVLQKGFLQRKLILLIVPPSGVTTCPW